ncbi:MAG: tetratricopeptide repeat protein, partial [Bacteroidota bacterium]
MKGLIRIVIFFLLTTGLSVTGWPVAAQTMSQPVHEDYQTGVKLFYEGLYEQAAGQLQEFLDTDPDRVLAEQAGYYLTLSRIALDSLRSDVYTNRFLKNHPTGPNALALLEDMAGRKYRAGDYPKAMSVYARAYRIETDVEGSARYLFWMAESARAMDSTDTSSTLYAELADRYPETDWAPRALYSRGQLYLEKEEFDRSAEMFEDLRDRYPTHPQRGVGRGATEQLDHALLGQCAPHGQEPAASLDVGVDSQQVL